MADIILNMFSDGFLDEIFRPQELCSRRALRTIFERLAHTSIMRLNETSMDKVIVESIFLKFKYEFNSLRLSQELVNKNDRNFVYEQTSDSYSVRSNISHNIEIFFELRKLNISEKFSTFKRSRVKPYSEKNLIVLTFNQKTNKI
jgi:hypothetical protein